MMGKGKSVRLIDFEEQLLTSGRKLLFVIFEDKFGDRRFRYRWPAPWADTQDGKGLVTLLVKAREVEEWNETEGAWSRELKEIAKELPGLEDLVLPAKIQIGRIEETVAPDNEGELFDSWSIFVEILTESGRIEVIKDKWGNFRLDVGPVGMDWRALADNLRELEGVLLVENPKTMWQEGWTDQYSEPLGVSFEVVVVKPSGSSRYRTIGREIAVCLRRFIRGRLGQYKSLRRGFEEFQGQNN